MCLILRNGLKETKMKIIEKIKDELEHWLPIIVIGIMLVLAIALPSENAKPFGAGFVETLQPGLSE